MHCVPILMSAMRLQRAMFEKALEMEPEGSDKVSVASLVKATFELHDVVAFSSVS